MPSESSFKSHIEATRSALAKFEPIAAIGLPAATQPALDELIVTTANYVKFNPWFAHDPRFFEVPLQVYAILEAFFVKNPFYKRVPAYNTVIGMSEKSKRIAASAAKKGKDRKSVV